MNANDVLRRKQYALLVKNLQRGLNVKTAKSNEPTTKSIVKSALTAAILFIKQNNARNVSYLTANSAVNKLLVKEYAANAQKKTHEDAKSVLGTSQRWRKRVDFAIKRQIVLANYAR